MRLQLQPEHLYLIEAEAIATYPNECCGLLLGKINRSPSQSLKQVLQVRPMINQWDDAAQDWLAEILPPDANHQRTQRDRYWINPKDMLEAQRSARAADQDIVGIYHSHPDHVAMPSECDRLLAWSGYSYLIVAVQRGSVQDLLCWSLDENHQFQPEEVQVYPAL
jgi:proteasome lid subunit RPN8/RPN11